MIGHDNKAIEEEGMPGLHLVEHIDSFPGESRILEDRFSPMSIGGDEHGFICLDRVSLKHEIILPIPQAEGLLPRKY